MLPKTANSEARDNMRMVEDGGGFGILDEPLVAARIGDRDFDRHRATKAGVTRLAHTGRAEHGDGPTAYLRFCNGR